MAPEPLEFFMVGGVALVVLRAPTAVKTLADSLVGTDCHCDYYYLNIRI